MTENGYVGRVVKTELDSQLEVDIERVRAYHGLKNYAEVLRFLIRQEARKLFESAPLFATEGQS